MEVIATDFGSETDIGVLVNRLGHSIVRTDRSGGLLRFLIRKT
jgi:TusA-related sulfurtransferase